VADGRDAEWVVMAGRAGSFRDMLGLRDVGWEGGAPAGEFDVDGTTADVNTWYNNGGSEEAVRRRTRTAISRQCSLN
jgi:hypothetical protein